MRRYEITFSPTGGTQKVVEAIGSAWEEEAVCLDLTEPKRNFTQEVFTPEDICMVGVPSFGGRVPDTAAKRIADLHGNGARAVAICVYGNRAYEDTLAELYDLLEQAGFRCLAAVAAVAEHSIMHQFAAGRPDEADQATLLDFGRQIRIRLETGAEAGTLSVPGNRPYKEYKAIPMVPHAEKSCTACGLCAGSCPVGAIDASNVKKADKSKCISCMKCIALCPEGARKLNPLLVAGAVQKLKKACSGRKANEIFL